MPRKLFCSGLLLILIFLFCSQFVFADSSKTYGASQFNVAATIASGGSMQVTESITFRFVGGPFTFVSRSIPTDNTDGISVVSAQMDGQSLAPGTAAGDYEVQTGNPVNVTWHFAPTSDASHTFVMVYRMQGVIQKASDSDLLDWEPLPTSHDYTIAASTVTIAYPATTSLIAAPEVAQGQASVTQSAGQVVFQGHNLAANATQEIGLRFRAGSLVTVAPSWQQQKERAQAFLPWCLAGGILIFLVGSFLFIRRYRRYRRSSAAGMLDALQVPAPPAAFPPAVAGVLATTSDGSPTWDHALGTLFDLMDRGVVTITPPLAGGWGAWFNGHPDFHLVLLGLPPDLRLHEAGLLKALFRDQSGIRPVVKVSRVGELYSSHSKLFSEPLKQEMSSLGFFEPLRQRVRHRLGCASGLLFVLSLFVAFMAFAVGPWPLLFLPLGFTAVSITAVFLWSGFSTYSDDAMQIKARWDAFAKFLRLVANSDQAMIGPQLFARYLPYAASFGVLVPWAKALRRQGMIALPSWFRTLVTAEHPGNEAESALAFERMVETTHELTHQSASSSSGGSHVSGSVGVAGGGSSSAG